MRYVLTEFDPPEGYPAESIPTNGKLQSNEVTFDKPKLVDEFGTRNLLMENGRRNNYYPTLNYKELVWQVAKK